MKSTFLHSDCESKIIIISNFTANIYLLFLICTSYYEYLWLRNKGVDASSLFEGLPLSLQADISLSLYKDLIERVKCPLYC